MEYSFESHIQHTFDSYCRTVVRNEARNIKKQYDRLKRHQISLNHLSQDEMNALFYYDKSISNSEIFIVYGIKIIVSDVQLAEAIKNLPEDLKKIILSFYFIGLNDREIGDYFGISAGSIWSRRKRGLKLLHRYWRNDCGE